MVTSSINYINESISLALNDSEGINAQKETLKQHKNIIGALKRQLNKRKKLYWQSQLWKHINYLRNMTQQRKDYPQKFSHEIHRKWRRQRKESSQKLKREN